MAISITTTESSVQLSNGAVELTVSTAFGPRIMSCGLPTGPNLLARLEDVKLPWRPGEDFNLRGGHRLWVAPEVRDLTYTPDDDPVGLEVGATGVVVATASAASNPFRREMEITLAESAPQVRICHRLTYEGDSTAAAAPWAITMLVPGGTALLPFGRGPAEQLQADRSIVLWPYTSLDDAGLRMTDDAVVVHGARSTPIKVGIAGGAGWAAYVYGDTALIKRAATDPSAQYAEHGAATQCYANDKFYELETLGPLRRMKPGATAEHVETWELRRLAATPESVDQLAATVMQAMA